MANLLYPMPANLTDFVGLLQYIDTIVPFGELLLLGVFGLSFITMKRYGSENAFVSSLFVSCIAGILLMALAIIPQDWLSFLLIATALSVVLIRRD